MSTNAQNFSTPTKWTSQKDLIAFVNLAVVERTQQQPYLPWTPMMKKWREMLKGYYTYSRLLNHVDCITLAYQIRNGQ